MINAPVSKRSKKWVYDYVIIICSCIAIAGFVLDIIYSLIAQSSTESATIISRFAKSVWLLIFWSSFWFSCLYLSIALSRYRHTRELFGKITSIVRAEMQLLANISNMALLLRAGKILPVLLGISATIIFFVSREPRVLIFLLLAISIRIWLWVRITIPPVGLFLSTSTSQSIGLHWLFKRAAKTLRVVSLLDSDNSNVNDIRSETRLDCLRTGNDSDWWEVIKILLRICPIIIIDATATTPGVIRERDHLLSSALHYKCIFMRGEGWETPLLDTTYLKNEEANICVVGRKQVFNFFQAIIESRKMPCPEYQVKEMFNEWLSVGRS